MVPVNRAFPVEPGAGGGWDPGKRKAGRYSLHDRMLVTGSIILVSLLSVAGCVSPVPSPGQGYLEGNVTIGPLCPVEPCHVTEAQLDAAYAARTLVISQEGMPGHVYQAGFPPGGHYQVPLLPGTYEVSILKNGVDRSPQLPAKVTIKPDKTVILDISVDTGIR